MFALNFNYFLEKTVKTCVVLSAVLKEMQIELHESMIYSSVRQPGF
jgi:hypothetical protein